MSEHPIGNKKRLVSQLDTPAPVERWVSQWSAPGPDQEPSNSGYDHEDEDDCGRRSEGEQQQMLDEFGLHGMRMFIRSLNGFEMLVGSIALALRQLRGK
jgi:hypothetical protein